MSTTTLPSNEEDPNAETIRAIHTHCNHLKSLLLSLNLPSETRNQMVLGFLGIAPIVPTGYSTTSNTPYYTAHHAEHLASVLHQVKKIVAADGLPAFNANLFGLTPHNLRARFNQAWQWLIEHPGDYTAEDNLMFKEMRANFRLSVLGMLVVFRQVGAAEAEKQRFADRIQPESPMFGMTVILAEKRVDLPHKGRPKRDDEKYIDSKELLETWLETAQPGDRFTSPDGVRFTDDQLDKIRLSLEDVRERFVLVTCEPKLVKIVRLTEEEERLMRGER